MSRLLRWYMRLILSRPIIRSIGWNATEREAFDLFCRSACGIKLFEFLRQVVATQTFQAVYANSVSANARARGMQDIFALLHRLRSFPNTESADTVLDDEQLGRVSVPESDQWRVMGGPGAIG